MQPSHGTTSASLAPTPFERPYTVILFALGAMALLNVFSLQLTVDIAPRDTELTASQFRAVLRYVQVTAGFLAVAYCVVGILRVRSSTFAPPATALMSIVSLLLFPFGTATFVYWVGWVRKREQTSQAA